MQNTKSNSRDVRKIALSGILMALTVIVLYAATVVPTNRLSLYAISSFFVSVVVMEYGAKSGWLFFAATGLLALAVVPAKLELIPYFIFFGVYGIIKYYIESLNRLALEYGLKLLFFNVSIGAAALLVKEFFLSSIKTDFPWLIVILAGEVVFIVYDYAYTLIIRYYREKIRKHIRF